MERKLTVVVVALRGEENVKMKTGKKKKNERFLWLRECVCVEVLKTQEEDSSQGRRCKIEIEMAMLIAFSNIHFSTTTFINNGK